MPTNQCTDENNAFTPTGSLIIITVDISKAFLVSANAIEIMSLALCPIPLSSSLQKLYLETSGVLLRCPSVFLPLTSWDSEKTG